MKKCLFILLICITFGCTKEEDKIIGKWNINALMQGKSDNLSEGTFEFQEDGILLIKIDKRINKLTWSLKNDSIIIDQKGYFYTIKNNRLKIIRDKKKELYIELIK